LLTYDIILRSCVGWQLYYLMSWLNIRCKSWNGVRCGP